MRSLLIWVGVSRTTSCEKSVYMINKSVTMLEKLRHTVEMRVRRCHIHMRPNHMNAAVSKWHKLTHQFCEIDFIQKVLVDVAGSNTVQTHLGHGRSQSEVPLTGKNKALVKILGIVNTGRPLQVKYWGGRDPCNPCGVDAHATTKQLLTHGLLKHATVFLSVFCYTFEELKLISTKPYNFCKLYFSSDEK